MKKTEYLSETELLNLIASAETDFSYKAPDYLKDQILRKTTKKADQKTALLFFSVKVAVGAAAAIALLFGMPDMAQLKQYSSNTAVSFEKNYDVFDRLNQKTNQFLHLLSDTANSVFIKED